MIKYRIVSIRFECGYVEMPFTFSNIYQDKLDSSNAMYFVLEWDTPSPKELFTFSFITAGQFRFICT